MESQVEFSDKGCSKYCYLEQSIQSLTSSYYPPSKIRDEKYRAMAETFLIRPVSGIVNIQKSHNI